jgi:prevent-host-death family protein
MEITATDFKARCLAILDQVQARRETVTITKRGKVVARVVPAGHEDQKPWISLRGSVVKYRRPLAPALDDSDIEALKK